MKRMAMPRDPAALVAAPGVRATTRADWPPPPAGPGVRSSRRSRRPNHEEKESMMRTDEARRIGVRVVAQWVLVGALVALVPAGSDAALTPAQKCGDAKSKAAGTTIGAKLACHQKAERKTAPVDPQCLAMAEGSSTPRSSRRKRPRGAS